MEVDQNTENWSVLTAARIKVKSTDISSIPHTTSININNTFIPIQMIPLLTLEERLSTVTPPTPQAVSDFSAQHEQKSPPQTAIQRPLSGRTFQKHYIRLSKKVTWATPQALQGYYRPKEKQLHVPSASDGQHSHLPKPLTSSPK